MNDRNDIPQSDAPKGWSRYKEVLQDHGRARAPNSLTEGLAGNWKNLHAARQRRRQWRFALVLPGAVLLVILVFSIDVAGIFQNGQPDVAPHVNIPHQEPANDEPEVFAAPAIPPVWLDSSLPAIDVSLPEALTDSTMIDIQFNPARRADTPVAGEPIR